jgi:hypothetical protein
VAQKLKNKFHNEFLTPHILLLHEHSGSRDLMLQAKPIEDLEN